MDLTYNSFRTLFHINYRSLVDLLLICFFAAFFIDIYLSAIFLAQIYIPIFLLVVFLFDKTNRFSAFKLTGSNKNIIPNVSMLSKYELNFKYKESEKIQLE